MKRVLAVFIATALFLCLPMMPTANAETESDFIYEVTDGKATITGYTGTATTLTTPSSLGGYPVTALASYAFADNATLTAVHVTSNILSIGSYCFNNCSNLSYFTMQTGVLELGGWMLADCHKITSVIIPSSVTTIGIGALAGCEGLTSIDVKTDNASFKDIDDCLYNKAGTSLLQVPAGKSGHLILPNTVTYIAMCAVRQSNLSSITIPDSVTDIDWYAFYYAKKLTSIVLPAGLTSIGVSVFEGVSSLETITIPASVTSISNTAFIACNGLKMAYFEGTPQQWQALSVRSEKIDKITHFDSTATHEWDNGKVTQASTCTQTGVYTYSCTGCSVTKTEDLPKTSTHTYDNDCDERCNLCGASRSITHRYGDWFKSQGEHWKACIVCGQKQGQSAHIPGAAATETTSQNCTVCGHVINAALGHTHSFGTAWKLDAFGHWHSCDCGSLKDYAEHAYVNTCDTDCNTCGYTRQITHTPGEPASATKAQVCTVCGKVLTSATEMEPTTETQTEPTTETQPESTTETQTETQMQNDDITEKGLEKNKSRVLWIIVAASAAVILIVIPIILLKKKSSKNKD